MRKDTIAALARAIARELAPDLLDMIREAASGRRHRQNPPHRGS